MPAARLVLLAALACCAAADEEDVEEVGEGMCTGTAFNTTGFGLAWDGLWWARHPNRSRWVNGRPTYHAGPAMTKQGWEDTGRWYVYWCRKANGGEGWNLAGPSGSGDAHEYDERASNFNGTNCAYLATKLDSARLMDATSEWKLSQLKYRNVQDRTKTVIMNSCGVQIDACDDDPHCPGFPAAAPFDKCVPVRRCGALEPTAGFVRVVSTSTQQETEDWTNVTVERYSDQYCIHPEGRYNVSCGACGAPGLLPSQEVSCDSLRALQLGAGEEGTFVTYIVVCIVVFTVLNIVISLYKYALFRRKKERAEQERRLDEATENAAPLLNRQSDLTDDIEEKLRIFYLRAAREKAASARVLAERAVRQAPQPKQFLHNLLLQRYPAEADLVRELFGAAPARDGAPADQNPLRTATSGLVTHLSDSASTFDYLKEAEDAVRAAEMSRHDREGFSHSPVVQSVRNRSHTQDLDEVPALNPVMANPTWRKKKEKAKSAASSASIGPSESPKDGDKPAGADKLPPERNGSAYTPPPLTPPPSVPPSVHPSGAFSSYDAIPSTTGPTAPSFSEGLSTPKRSSAKKKKKRVGSSAPSAADADGGALYGEL
eukprot:TRINITY_DN1585_c0_g1_i1.p1 TRINITY_DN1585_c0_g1~~TRINITY_DN1585_c0_g1_i1.p1  ORF type:complete len:623 (+),score=234.68 TRINITY_DN1585_c0_g1_i1:67-1869(+)